jgi:hypothetical protein
MAEIDFYGYIDEVRGNWLLRVAEPHSKLIEGKWQTISRTWRDVKPAHGSGLDFSEFLKGTRVKVSGVERTEMREHEGKKFYDLQVRAMSVEAAPLPPRQETPNETTSTRVAPGSGSPSFKNIESPGEPPVDDWHTAELGSEPF